MDARISIAVMSNERRTIRFYILPAYFLLLTSMSLSKFIQIGGSQAAIGAAVLLVWALSTLFSLLFNVGRSLLAISMFFNGAIAILIGYAIVGSVPTVLSQGRTFDALAIVFVVGTMFVVANILAIRRLWRKYKALRPQNHTEIELQSLLHKVGESDNSN